MAFASGLFFDRRARSGFAPNGQAHNPESPQTVPRDDARPVAVEAMSGQWQRRHSAAAIRAHTRKKPTRLVQPSGAAPRGGSAPANQCELQDSWAWAADALRQAAFIEAEGEFIAGGCGEVRETVVHFENKSSSH